MGPKVNTVDRPGSGPDKSTRSDRLSEVADASPKNAKRLMYNDGTTLTRHPGIRTGPDHARVFRSACNVRVVFRGIYRPVCGRLETYARDRPGRTTVVTRRGSYKTYKTELLTANRGNDKIIYVHAEERKKISKIN